MSWGTVELEGPSMSIGSDTVSLAAAAAIPRENRFMAGTVLRSVRDELLRGCLLAAVFAF